MPEYPFSPLKTIYKNTDVPSTVRYEAVSVSGNWYVQTFTETSPRYHLSRIKEENISFDSEQLTYEEMFEEIYDNSIDYQFSPFGEYWITYNNEYYFCGQKHIYKLDINGVVSIYEDMTSILDANGVDNLQDYYLKDDYIYVIGFNNDNNKDFYIFKKQLGTVDWTIINAFHFESEFYMPDMRFFEYQNELYFYAEFENSNDDNFNTIIYRVNDLAEVFSVYNYVSTYESNWEVFTSNYMVRFRDRCVVFNNKIYVAVDDRIYILEKIDGEWITNYITDDRINIIDGFHIYKDRIFVDNYVGYDNIISRINNDNTLTELITIDDQDFIFNYVTDSIFLFVTILHILLYDYDTDTFSYITNFASYSEYNNYIPRDMFALSDGNILFKFDSFSAVSLLFPYILENRHETNCTNSQQGKLYYRRDNVIPVTKLLALACDSSGSIDSDEYTLQMQGYAYAFRTAAPYITPEKMFASCLTQWSDYGSAEVVIPWTLVYDDQSAYAFATLLENAPRYFGGMTGAIAGLLHANETLEDCDFEATEKIIDMSGDGVDNDTPGNLVNLRPNEDIMVNAITIDVSGSTYIYDWYQSQVIQGEDAFVMGVESFEDFQDAITTKIIRELDIDEEEEPEEDTTEIEDDIIVSPLVDVREIDFSATAIAQGKIGVIILRNTYKGPEKEKVFITNERELTDMFGRPSTNVYCIQDILSAIAYLRDSDKLYCTRVMPSDATFAGLYCTQGVSGSYIGFTSDAPILDVNIFNPDRYHEEVGSMYDNVLMNVIAINRGEFGNNLRIAIVDKITYDEIKLRQHSTYQIYNDVFKIDSPLFDEKNFLLIVQERNIITNTWSTVEVHNVSSDENAIDDTQGKLFVEAKVNMYSKYIRVAWNRLYLNQDMTFHFTSTYQRLSGGTNGTGDVTDATIFAALDLYQNPEETDVNFFIDSNKSLPVKSYIIDICEHRKDCVAVLDVPRELVVHNVGTEVTDLIEWRDNTFNENSSYAALYASWLKVKNKFTKNEIWMPSSGYVAGIYSRSDNLSEPWYAPAGHNRATLKEVERLSWHPNVEKRDELYQHGINSVVTFANIGHVVWGQKNLLDKSSAFNRVNIRRLFVTLEKTIATAAANFVFEPNNENTRMIFNNLIEPFLKDVKAKNGITDFIIISNEANNTPERIERKFAEIANILEPEEYKYIKEGYHEE